MIYEITNKQTGCVVTCACCDSCRRKGPKAPDDDHGAAIDAAMDKGWRQISVVDRTATGRIKRRFGTTTWTLKIYCPRCARKKKPELEAAGSR